MIAFDAEAQSLAILGFLLAQNATSASRYQEDPTCTDSTTETHETTSNKTSRP
ncbi:hypothetical protein ACFWGI_31310 [Streptomyces niveus]|uniref:hypothetical protein n=1 Tax=Streptomyces niveus TaxID=193462 RepID=UPI0036494EAB